MTRNRLVVIEKKRPGTKVPGHPSTYSSTIHKDCDYIWSNYFLKKLPRFPLQATGQPTHYENTHYILEAREEILDVRRLSLNRR